MQNLRIARSELPASSHAANSGAERSTSPNRKLSIGKSPIKLDTSHIDDSDFFKALELSKQTVLKSRYELEPEEALWSRQEVTTRLNPNFRTGLRAAREESLRINKSNGRGNFMFIQEMVAKATRLKLARG